MNDKELPSLKSQKIAYENMKSNDKLIAELEKEVKRLRDMFDTTRHRVLRCMNEDDMGKSWKWIEYRVDVIPRIDKLSKEWLEEGGDIAEFGRRLEYALF